MAQQDTSERIIADLAEFKRSNYKYPCITLLPTEDDIYEYHCNIALNDDNGKFCGAVIHLILNFPENYPLKPPKITVSKGVSNGKKILLDKVVADISNKQGKKKEYTVESVLMKLQSFLVEKSGIDISKDLSKYDCKKCDSTKDAKIINNSSSNNNKVKKSVKVYKISDDNKTDEKEEKHMDQIVSINGNNKNNNNNKKMGQCMGFVVNVHFCDDTETMKSSIYGSKNIGKKRIESIQRKIGKYDLISFIDTEDKLISSSEFEKRFNNIDNTNNKDYKSIHFIPLDLNRKHGELSMQLMEKYITNIFTTKLEYNQKYDNNNNQDNISLYRDYSECIGLTYLFNNSETQLIPGAKEALQSIFYLYARSAIKNSKNGKRKMIKMSLNELEEYLNDIYSLNNNDNNNSNSVQEKEEVMADIISFIKTNYPPFSNTISLKQFLGYYTSIAYSYHNVVWMHLEQMGFDSQLSKIKNAPIEMRKGKKPSKKLSKKQSQGNNTHNNNDHNKYHPLLSLYTVSNCMKSLISNVIQKSKKDGNITIDDCINILSTFIKYHHLLLSIYYLNKDELKPIIQDQINSFVNKNNTNIPDLGVFLMYLTLWERGNNNNNNDNLNWNSIGNSLLDELFVRQIKCVFDKYPRLIQNSNKTNANKRSRVRQTWDAAILSNRLFLVQHFFLKYVCQLSLFNNNNGMTPESKYFEYNKNLVEKINNKERVLNLALQLQKFVSDTSKCNYNKFFETLEIKNPSRNALSDWLFDCVHKSEFRYYHNPHVYYSKC